MSLSGALNAAISGISANQRQIQVVSGNVSNANVEGFSKKSLPQSTNVVGLDTNGGVQTGVVQREVNEFLRGRIQNAESELSASETKKEFFQRVQDFFGKVDDNNTLSSAIDQVRKAIEDLSVNPENGAIRQQVVAKAQELAGKFRTFTQQTQELRGQADLQIKQSVQSVNENLREIKELNAQISQAEALQKSSAELRDQRDQAIKELSKQIDVNTFTRDTGEVVVVTADENARQLVDGSAAELAFNAAGSLGSGEPGGRVTYSDGTNVDPDTVGGRLGALLQLRNQDLPNFQADLDRLAAQVREEVNAAHNLGQVGNEVTQGTDQITGAHRFDQDVTDGTQGDTPISDIGGSFEIVRVNGSGNVQNTVSIDLDAIESGPNPGTVQDLVNQMNNYARNQGPFAGPPSPNSNPATQDVFSLNGQGKLQVSSPDGPGTDFVVRQNADSPATISSSTLSPTSDQDGDGNGTRNVSHFFGLNNFLQTPDANARDANGNQLSLNQNNPELVTGDTGDNGTPARTGPGVSAAGVIQVNQDIVDAPRKLARISPKNTDGENPLPTGDATVVRKLANAFEDPTTFTGPQAFETGGAAGLTNNPSGGNLDGRQATLANFAGDILQDQASRTSNTEQAVKAESGVKEQLELRAENQSGVNIDEELARLSTFQQAFNANARVISVVDEMFSTLNQAVR